MAAEVKERYGQRVVDHFSSLPHNPYEQAETLEDLGPALNVVRTLLKLGRFQEAANAYKGELGTGLLFNLEAHVETISTLRPFFTTSWSDLPKGVNVVDACYIANNAAVALIWYGEPKEAIATFGSVIYSNLNREAWSMVNAALINISYCLMGQKLNLLKKGFDVNNLSLELASVQNEKKHMFLSRLRLFVFQSRFGQWEASEETWALLDPMGRRWDRALYRQGTAEAFFAQAMFWQNNLQDKHLTAATSLAENGNNRPALRLLHRLRGVWMLERGEWASAESSFHESLSMARDRKLQDVVSQVGLGLAKFHLGQLYKPDEVRQQAEWLDGRHSPAQLYLAMLWLAIGDPDQAKYHALAAYRWAWADGRPYTNHYELTKTTELLQQMNVPIPTLSPYDPAMDESFPWEAEVRAAIEKLQTEKIANEKAEKKQPD